MKKSQSMDPAKYRKEFPFTKEIVFFNHASFGPMPEVSWRATQDYYRGLRLKKVADDDREAFQKLESIRKLIAKMIKANPPQRTQRKANNWGRALACAVKSWKTITTEARRKAEEG